MEKTDKNILLNFLIILSVVTTMSGCFESSKSDDSIGLIGALLFAQQQSVGPMSATQTTTTNLRVFVTASQFYGDFGNTKSDGSAYVSGETNPGNIANADAKCNADANKPAGTGTYKALFYTRGNANDANSGRFACADSLPHNVSLNTIVSGSFICSNPRNWVLEASRTYANRNGQIAFTTNAQRVFFNIENAITTDDVKVWTGFSLTQPWAGNLVADTSNRTNFCYDWTVRDNTLDSISAQNNNIRGIRGKANAIGAISQAIFPNRNNLDDTIAITDFGSNGDALMAGEQLDASCNTQARLICVEQP